MIVHDKIEPTDEHHEKVIPHIRHHQIEFPKRFLYRQTLPVDENALRKKKGFFFSRYSRYFPTTRPFENIGLNFHMKKMRKMFNPIQTWSIITFRFSLLANWNIVLLDRWFAQFDSLKQVLSFDGEYSLYWAQDIFSQDWWHNVVWPKEIFQILVAQPSWWPL